MVDNEMLETPETPAAFKPGDRVLYLLPTRKGRPTVVRLPAVVMNVTNRRVVIRVGNSRNHRAVMPANLAPTTAAAPDTAA